MVDYLKIGLSNPNGVNIIIGTQQHSNNATLTCEIRNLETIFADEIKLTIDDTTVNDNLKFLAESFCHFYNDCDLINEISIEQFSNETLKIILIKIFKRLPFLKNFQITHIGFGFSLSFEKYASRSKIEVITSKLFKKSNVNKATYAYYGLSEKDINSKSKCSAFSLNIVLENELKAQFKNVIF